MVCLPIGKKSTDFIEDLFMKEIIILKNDGIAIL